MSAVSGIPIYLNDYKIDHKLLKIDSLKWRERKIAKLNPVTMVTNYF